MRRFRWASTLFIGWLISLFFFQNCSSGSFQQNTANSSQNNSSSSGSSSNPPNTSNPPTTTTNPTPTSTGAPLVLFTDALTGPITGGENNLGAYLSIYGKNFGSDLTKVKVYIGSNEVANYRYLGLSKAAGKNNVQQIAVQVGNLGGASVGTALPIKVVVNGVASNLDSTFTPCTGRILFVSLTGNDATAVVNDINHPWRHLQVFTGSSNTLSASAYLNMQAGDHIVLRGGDWTDSVSTGAAGWSDWVRFAGIGTNNGQERNGTAAAWIHFTAYPGPISGNAIEDVHHTAQASTSGGFAGPQSSAAGTTGEYISISNLRMDIAGGANRDAAPFNFQYTAGPWRVVNNEIGPWIAGNSAILNAAGISGHGPGHKIFGNLIHDIQGTSDLQNHGIYADVTAENWEISYNWIHDMTGGSLIQFNDNEGAAGTYTMPHGGVWPGFIGMRVHHNWLENAAKYGINYNDQFSAKNGSYEGEHWNNVIIGTQMPPIRINSTQPNLKLSFAYNTLYNCVLGTGLIRGYVSSEGWSTYVGSVSPSVIQNTFYNNIFAFGPGTTSGTTWFADAGAGNDGVATSTSTWDFKKNIYYSASQSVTAPSSIGDNVAIVANPLFTNATSGNFTLPGTSPAVDAALSGLPLSVTDDYNNKARPSGVASDIGAFEN